MRILLVAYHFPPDSNGGVQRPLHFQRNLASRGHAVRVLTHGGCDDLAGDVLRIASPAQHRRMRWLARRAWQRACVALGRHRSPYDAWRDAVLRRLDAVVEAARPDVIVATYPPVEALEIGLALSARAGAPLVVDLRDGLLFEPIDKAALRAPCTRRRYEAIDADIAARAAAVVTVSPPISRAFAAAHPTVQVETIPNGFEPADFAGAVARPAELPPDRFNLVFTGQLARSEIDNDIAPFLAALAAARARGAERVLAHFVGAFTRRERRAMRTLEAVGAVRVHPPLNRATAITWQRCADALLLVTSTARTSIATTKLFEYLAAARPIVALTAGTYAEEIVRSTGAGWTVAPRDVAAIADLLAQLPILPPPPRDEAAVRRFTRRDQALRLEELLVSAVAGR